jgi:colanic acid biosynthesis glycosyl transferase WcaI
MARILLLTLVFPPDSVSTAVLLGELSKELKTLGNDITVLTTTPHYNEEPEARRLQPLYKKSRGALYKSDYFGIPVYHVPINRKGDRIASRIFDYVRFHIVSTTAGFRVARGCDIILSPSPPLTIGLSAWIIGIMRKIPFIYNVQEIYPDVAVSLDVLTNRYLIWALQRLELFIYKRARSVVVISEWFRRRLLSKGVSTGKVSVIPNFVDTEFIVPGMRINTFSREHGLEDKFVLLYAGNIGLTQNFEIILSAARHLCHLRDLRFIIVGDGARRSWLEKELSRGDFRNVKLLPYQARSVVPSLYAASDVCLISLKRGTARETFPSKIYTIMAAGRPAIVAADEDSELTWVTKVSGFGWAVAPDDARVFTKAIEVAYQKRSELQNMGQLGRKYVVRHHSPAAISCRYDELIRGVMFGKPLVSGALKWGK